MTPTPDLACIKIRRAALLFSVAAIRINPGNRDAYARDALRWLHKLDGLAGAW